MDLSSSGCLLQTDEPLEAGTTGELQVDLEGSRFRDGLHVVRTIHRCGTHASHFAAQFAARTEESPHQSMRFAVQTIASDRLR